MAVLREAPVAISFAHRTGKRQGYAAPRSAPAAELVPGAGIRVGDRLVQGLPAFIGERGLDQAFEQRAGVASRARRRGSRATSLSNFIRPRSWVSP